MANKYFPALIICAGGTGIKVGRYLQSIADAGLDLDLKQRLDNGSIQIVGIDTDSKSNEKILPIDPNLLDAKDTPAGEREKIPSHLSRLPRNWLHLDRAALNHAVERVHEVISPGDQVHLEEANFHEPLATIRRWFPLKNEKTGDQITKGHSKNSGAAQWRPLGRMSLFLNAQRVYETLFKAFKIVQQSDPEMGPVQAYITCSLAGGTGSGMFWDLAFFLQMIDPSTRTNGLFLLGDPFEGVDEAGRIYPNIYASLKEIATYKNWREPLTVKYPISRGRSFKGQPQGPRAFDMAYLYQSFPPGPDVTDVARGTIEATCYRMSQNLISLIRRDLHGELDVGANNIDSDATSMASQLESSYCFSTTGATMFNMKDPDGLAAFIRARVIDERKPKGFDVPNPRDAADLLDSLNLSNSPSAFQDFLGELVNKISQIRPQTIDQSLARLDDPQSDVNRDDLSTKDLLNLLSDEMRSGMNAAAKSGSNMFSAGSVEANYRQHIQDALSRFEETLREKVNQFQSGMAPLDPQTEDLLVHFSLALDKDLPVSRVPDDNDIKVPLPPEYKKIQNIDREKPDLSLFQQTTNGLWKFLSKRDWVEEAHKKGLNDILNKTKASLSQSSGVSKAKLNPLINEEWNKRRAGIKSQIDTIVDYSKKTRIRNRRLRQVTDQIRKEFEFDRKTKEIMDQAQMNELLRSIIPPTSSDDSWFQMHAQGILNRIKVYFPDRKGDDDSLMPVVTRETVDAALRELVAELSDQYQQDPGNLNHELLVRFIKDSLPRFEGSDLDGADDNQSVTAETERARAYVANIGEVAREIVHYWNSQGNLILQQAGGQASLRERLLRCKSKLFANGIIENKLNKKHLVVLPFSKSSNNYTEMEKRRLKESFDVVAQEVMHTNSTVVYASTESPCIFFNDLFRSAEEISRIRDYYNSYSSYTEDGNTTFFHIDRGMAGIPDIVGDAIEIQPVNCGNNGCEYNLRNLPRNKLICPGCTRPIWNRCGNRKCYADNLRELLGELNPGGKPRYPFECPACSEDLKTYWWRCPDEKHPKKIPADKETCPQCLVDYQQGKRPHEDVHRRPDLRDRECPGCMDLEKHDPSERTIIPHSMEPYYNEGVNGHDTLQFRELLAGFRDDPRYQITAHLCPNTGTEHYLFPTCPEDHHDPDKRHHLYRNDDDRFVCTRHPHLRFMECNHCGYPLSEERDHDNGCPRCLKPVVRCDFCSDKFKKLYTPLERSNPERCPNCYNVMKKDLEIDLEDITNGIQEPAFCANIYSCPAGSEPWLTASDYNLKTCRACPEPASPLMPHGDLADLVDNCPLCSMVLSPLPKEGRTLYFSGRMIAKVFNDKAKIPAALARVCIICGTDARFVLKWMMEDGFLENGNHPRAKEDPPNEVPDDLGFIKKALENYHPERPELSFQDALEILTILREESEDRAAFIKLKRVLGLDNLLGTSLRRHESLLAACEKGSRAGHTLRKRLTGVWRHQQELKNRTLQWVHKDREK